MNKDDMPTHHHGTVVESTLVVDVGAFDEELMDLLCGLSEAGLCTQSSRMGFYTGPNGELQRQHTIASSANFLDRLPARLPVTLLRESSY
jgi:hypothetical protein